MYPGVPTPANCSARNGPLGGVTGASGDVALEPLRCEAIG